VREAGRKPPERELRVEARDAQGRLRFSWPARVVPHAPARAPAHEPEVEKGETLVLCGDWERPLRLPDGRTVPVLNRSLEFYDRRKPYAVAALFDRAWELQEYYARLIRPPHWDLTQGKLLLEMLGLDVRIEPDYEYELLEHAPEARPSLSPADEEALRGGMLALLEELERREGVFDPEGLREWVERARRM
jgi:hypothetical protein